MSFDRAVNFVLDLEGGYVDNPNDPGGATKFGISTAFLKSIGDKTDVRSITKDKAKEYYYEYFWRVLRCDEIKPYSIQLLLFDTGVNMGKSLAVQLLQFSLRPFKPVSIDGIIGNETLSAVEFATNTDTNTQFLADYFATERKHQYLEFIRRKENLVFLKGWFNRVNKILAEIAR